MTLNLPDGDAWAKCQDSNDPTNWVILSFVEGSKTDMTSACGTGGLAEFVATLQDDQIHYAAFVIYGVDERGNVTSRREKFVSVTWVGENVKVMAKSKVSGQRSAAMAYFSGAHIAYQIMDGDRDDISEAELQKKLLQVGGAHKPKYYDFGGASGEAAKAAKSGDSGEGGLGMPTEKNAPAQGTAADLEKVRLHSLAGVGEDAFGPHDDSFTLRSAPVTAPVTPHSIPHLLISFSPLPSSPLPKCHNPLAGAPRPRGQAEGGGRCRRAGGGRR
jgi:hypothetical protein